MKLQTFPVKILSCRDKGPSGLQYTFQFKDELINEALSLLVVSLPVHGEITVPSPRSGDCYLEARRVPSGFEIKEGCHGRAGDWKFAAEQEAIDWLLSGAGCPETRRSGWQLDLPHAKP